ncbi:MAG: DUF4956 domain-containing protein [Bacteroidales bacterium]|nr:DUF4956 domain-containing protein [Bacteroidales bacterium]
MITAKQITMFFLLLLLAMPVMVCIPQQIDPEWAQFDETSTKDADETGSKDKKEKKKAAKILEMNEKFLISLGINLLNVALIIMFIYYPNYRKLDYIFAFIMFNLVIFLLTFVLKYVKLSVGAAFGLFAVFSMLRYRTQGISMKDLTYLFIFIAMGVISSIQLEYYELAVIHGIILLGTFVLDGNVIFKGERIKRIEYENIEMIKPANQAALIADLRSRTGLNIHRVVVGKIDFLKDSAVVKVYYYE